jgi:hypothetical protein
LEIKKWMGQESMGDEIKACKYMKKKGFFSKVQTDINGRGFRLD